jgi:hypothetical protein
MVPEDSLPCSQDPAASPCAEPDRSRPQPCFFKNKKGKKNGESFMMLHNLRFSPKNWYCYQISKDEMHRICYIYGKDEKCM